MENNVRIMKRKDISTNQNSRREPTEDELREGRRRVIGRIIDLMRELVSVKGEYGREWHGTSMDLLELIHVAWFYGNFTNDRGRNITFRDMARKVCRTLHFPCPANPYTVAELAKSRKGIYSASVIERYTLLNVRYGIRNPMFMDMPYCRVGG